MKRQAFVNELRRKGCDLKRHGSNHDIYINLQTGQKAPIPRHSELADSLCQLIKKQLGL
ncbi:MAG: type II toxin-antitoxin system HicA family toxin [Dehalococcoidales bacterium]|nr:type II toxin-antitoxin system HicA family toxin [Dehalococcoidales bacterium]